MNGPIYLLCSSEGYFISFSKMQTLTKCKVLYTKPEQIKTFYTEKDLTAYLLTFCREKTFVGKHFNRKDIVMGEPVMWSQYLCQCCPDLLHLEFYNFWPDGVVEVYSSTTRRLIGKYVNCQNQKMTDKKTVNWILRHGYAYGYGFLTHDVYTYTKDGLSEIKNMDTGEVTKIETVNESPNCQ